MAAETVDIAITGPQLDVTLPVDSIFRSGTARIYLANVLGLEFDEEVGYRVTGPSVTPQLLKEIIEYFGEHDASVQLNNEAKGILEQLERQEAELEASREAGLEAKENPATTLDVPTFKRDLKPYQIPAVAHLVAVGNGANFSVPGSGKTTMVLAAFAILRHQKVVDKIVVIGPRASFMPWEDEFKGCFGRIPEKVRVVGTKAARKGLYASADHAELVLLTYQMASNDAEELGKFLRKHKVMLILDESHNIKRLEGGKWAETLLGLAPFAARRVVLSGTPVPNSIVDLWSQITFLWPTEPLLGPRERFKQMADADEEERTSQVQDTLRPFYWRVKKSDLKLPKPKFRRISVPMSPYQSAIYQALAAKVLADVVKAPEDRVKLRMWRRARTIRLMQAATNPTLLTQYSAEFQVPPLDATALPVDQIIEKYSDYEVPSKLDAAAKLVRKLTGKGHKVLVWSTFVHNIKTLRTMLSDLEPDAIYGDIPKDDDEDAEVNRERIIREFKASDKPKVLIANPAACAESVSLHKVCFHAIYLDRSFNAAHYMQSLDRIHRVGLMPGDKVNYYILMSKDSVDEVIDGRLEEKQRELLRLLDDDFAIVNLESPADQLAEESEEDADFAALLESLKATVKVS